MEDAIFADVCGKAQISMPAGLDFLDGDHVRLHGLKAKELNDKPGVIVSRPARTGRYGVLVHGASSAVAVKADKFENTHTMTVNAALIAATS